MRLLAQTLRLAGRGPSLTILSYHRVLAAPSAMLPDYPTQREFAEQIRAAKRWLQFAPLADAWNEVASSRSNRHFGAVTFDDGYRDNLEFALPVLSAERVPATVFLATAYTNGEPFFVDQITESIARTKVFRLDARDLGLPILELSSTEERLNATRVALELAKYRAPAQRDALATELARRLQVGDLSRLLMNAEEIRQAHRGGLRAAAHMHRHQIMTAAPEDQIREDLSQNIEAIMQITGERPTEFAYPNGKPGADFMTMHQRLLQEFGIRIAVTTEYGIAVPGDNPHQLPRYSPWDRNPRSFGLRLFMDVCRETRHPARLPTGITETA